MFTNASLKLRMLVNIVHIVYNERKNEKKIQRTEHDCCCVWWRRKCIVCKRVSLGRDRDILESDHDQT